MPDSRQLTAMATSLANSSLRRSIEKGVHFIFFKPLNQTLPRKTALIGAQVLVHIPVFHSRSAAAHRPFTCRNSTAGRCQRR